ncbi:GNAT family N-acetyltransferase [Clostridium sp. 19966]|uniref:GNAT family N-acetyltransferase n=1 Tax=Clostridium sp. 19966 TaxID=2768166 RepID=UPI0028DF774D|nr:GNAT family N-acetyltransferase [Clostridium sp. 19966]MDT8719697.1 GNAT family N-acetyltransferase [Clostridium sp. 19966]
MNLTYGPAETADIELLFQLNKDLIDRYENISQINYSKVLSWVRNKIEKHIDEYTCIFQDNQKVGYYRLHSADEKMELDDLYVLSPYQGQGIGSEIIRKCIAETDFPIFLYVFIQNTKAVSLYKRFGFRITETIKDSRYIMEK